MGGGEEKGCFHPLRPLILTRSSVPSAAVAMHTSYLSDHMRAGQTVLVACSYDRMTD